MISAADVTGFMGFDAQSHDIDTVLSIYPAGECGIDRFIDCVVASTCHQR